jgi:hypothetical protein
VNREIEEGEVTTVILALVGWGKVHLSIDVFITNLEPYCFPITDIAARETQTESARREYKGDFVGRNKGLLGKQTLQNKMAGDVRDSRGM